jgi:NADPH2:quinone reductase
MGNATGAVEPFSILTLALKGSLTLARPQVYSYVQKREDLERGAQALFSMISSGAINIDISARYALEQAAQAHIAVESGTTTGSTILLP